MELVFEKKKTGHYCVYGNKEKVADVYFRKPIRALKKIPQGARMTITYDSGKYSENVKSIEHGKQRAKSFLEHYYAF